jgi:cytochrome c biogenesis protein
MPEDIPREKKSLNLIDKLWDFFTSLKLIIVLLLVLSVLSVFGTVVEQNKPLQEYYGYLSPETVDLFGKLGLLDMYHSWWFTSCLALLALNIIACTMERYPSIMKGMKAQSGVLDEKLEAGLAGLTKIKYNLSAEMVEERVKAAAGKDFGTHPAVTEEEHARHFFYEKGRYSRLSFFLTHLSVLVIFVGAMTGSLIGFKGYVNINEGETISSVGAGKGGSRELKFGVRCNAFAVDYYANGAPKDYRSDLSIIKDGKEVARKTIRVNDPLSYEGITFYQSSFGGAPDVTLEVRDKKGTPLGNVFVPFGRRAPIPGSSAGIEVADYQEHFHLPDGSEGGPAIGLNIYSPDAPAEGIWITGAPQAGRNRSGDYSFVVKDMKLKKYTGLQVNKDPGVWLVWTGCCMLVAGIMMAFFMAHRKLWIKIRKDKKGRVEVTLGGTANKNKHAFSGELGKLAESLREVS